MSDVAVVCIDIQRRVAQNHQKEQKSNLQPLITDELFRNEKACNKKQFSKH